jgi:tRNA(adenine34) deaminase
MYHLWDALKSTDSSRPVLRCKRAVAGPLKPGNLMPIPELRGKTMDDEFFMKKALEQARQALAAGEFPVGCVIVHANKILVTGAREGTTGENLNEVDHAEMVALKRLSRLEQKFNMQNVTVFSTLEPCLMCYGALMISGVGKIVFAFEDAMGGGTGCDRAQLAPLYARNRIKINSGVLRSESLELLKFYFSKAQNTYLKDSLLATYTLNQ